MKCKSPAKSTNINLDDYFTYEERTIQTNIREIMKQEQDNGLQEADNKQ